MWRTFRNDDRDSTKNEDIDTRTANLTTFSPSIIGLAKEVRAISALVLFVIGISSATLPH